MTCHICQGDHIISVDRELLLDLEVFLDDRADVRDSEDGPRPNAAMYLLQRVQEVLSRIPATDPSALASETPQPSPSVRSGAGAPASEYWQLAKELMR